MKADAFTRTLIAVVILSSWAAINYGLFFGHVSIPVHLEPLAQRALGILDAVLMLVVSFFYATSSSSQKKTDLLAKAAPIPEDDKP